MDKMEFMCVLIVLCATCVLLDWLWEGIGDVDQEADDDHEKLWKEILALRGVVAHHYHKGCDACKAIMEQVQAIGNEIPQKFVDEITGKNMEDLPRQDFIG